MHLLIVVISVPGIIVHLSDQFKLILTFWSSVSQHIIQNLCCITSFKNFGLITFYIWKSNVQNVSVCSV